LEQVVVVLDAAQAIAVSDLILADENFVGAFKRCGNDEASTLVVEGREYDRS
jgi:hypothetical protein